MKPLDFKATPLSASAILLGFMETIKAALEEAGSSMKDVVRTRMLLTRIADWEQIALVRGEYFKDIQPVDTVMEVSRFIKSEWLVEIEVDVVVANGDA